MIKKIYEWATALREKFNEKGQGMVEYALILAAVAIIAVVAIWGTTVGDVTPGTTSTSLKDAVVSAFNKAAGHISTATK